MDFIKQQKRVLTGLTVFLFIMFLLTLISKAVYAYNLPQVTVDTPQRKSITHRVTEEGIVVAGRECPFNVPAGMRVRAVLVNAGDKVEKGTAVFEIDTDDLSKMIAEKELAICKLELQINDLEKDKSRADKDREKMISRANEDYDRAVFEGQVCVGRAMEELRKAEKRLGDFRKHDDDDNDNDNDNDNEDNDDDVRSEEREALQEAVNAAMTAVQNAEWDANLSVIEAGRRLDDAKASTSSDSTPTMMKMELDALGDELDVYREVFENGGVIYADQKGVITRINVFPGERTTDGTALLLADLSVPVMFRAILSKDEKKYVICGDTVKLDFGRYASGEYVLDYLTEKDAGDGTYEARIMLGKGDADIGQSGTFCAESKSEPYRCCVPITALREDGAKRRFVYTVTRRSGILGDELAVRAVYVKVPDENDSIAAIEDSSIDSDTEIVLSSTKELKDGMVVRYFSPE